jgi:hypothetical protein
MPPASRRSHPRTFPFARQPGVNRKQIRGFAELEFIAKAENIVFVGETDLATLCTPLPHD